VAFALRHMRRGPGGAPPPLRFAPLGGETARALLPPDLLPMGAGHDPSTAVLWDGGQVALRSRAVLGVLAHLRWPWRLALVLRLAPTPLLDWGYGLVARHRARLARPHTCNLPPGPPDILA